MKKDNRKTIAVSFDGNFDRYARFPLPYTADNLRMAIMKRFESDTDVIWVWNVYNRWESFTKAEVASL